MKQIGRFVIMTQKELHEDRQKVWASGEKIGRKYERKERKTRNSFTGLDWSLQEYMKMFLKDLGVVHYMATQEELGDNVFEMNFYLTPDETKQE